MRRFSAPKQVSGAENSSAMFFPSGRRFGHQNSNASTPMSSGGVCLPKLETAGLTVLNTEVRPETISELIGMLTSGLAMKQMKTYCGAS